MMHSNDKIGRKYLIESLLYDLSQRMVHVIP